MTGDEIVVVAHARSGPPAANTVRVGQTIPFVPPFGIAHLAHAGEDASTLVARATAPVTRRSSACTAPRCTSPRPRVTSSCSTRRPAAGSRPRSPSSPGALHHEPLDAPGTRWWPGSNARAQRSGSTTGAACHRSVPPSSARAAGPCSPSASTPNRTRSNPSESPSSAPGSPPQPQRSPNRTSGRPPHPNETPRRGTAVGHSVATAPTGRARKSPIDLLTRRVWSRRRR